MDIYSFQPIQFSKIYITGPLTPSMPYIVLKELALERSFIVNIENMKDPFYYIRVFKKILKIQPPIISNLDDKFDYKRAMDIVNPFYEWDVDILKKAFSFLNYFQNIYKEEKTYSLYSFTPCGLQTPEIPYKINACIYYGICRYKNIQLSLDISYEELKHKVVMLYITNINITEVKVLDSEEEIESIDIDEHQSIEEDEVSERQPVQVLNTRRDSFENESDEDIPDLVSDSSEEIIQSSIKIQQFTNGSLSFNHIDDYSLKAKDSINNDVILTIDLTKEQKFNFFDNFSTIQSIGELFEDINYLRQNFDPKNDEQAIVAGVFVHARDYSKCESPLEDFISFDKLKKTKDIYIREYESMNPNYIDLNLYFNPYLPKSLYKKQLLDHHINLFSYATYLYIGLHPYEILQELHLENNFYLGWHPNILNHETPIDLDIINDLSNEEIICYGIKDETLHATSWNELYRLFKNMNLFVNPFEKNSVFHVHKVERLLKLGRWILDPPYEHRYLFNNYKKETLDTIIQFVDLLDDMLLFQKSEYEIFKEYNQKYLCMTKKQSDDIIITFEKLFELIMFMRGWTHHQSYPITNVPFSNNDITEKNSLEGLMVLDEWNQKTSEFVYSLPLMIWKNEFVKSHLVEQGFTIGDRIAIVKNGESDNINSCIRMTSNVLGSSYCFYCKLFKIPQKFDIRDLVYIQ